MHETSPAPQPAPAAIPEIAASEIDVSCRAPLFVLFIGAAFWGLLGSVLAMIASIQFQSPAFLAGAEWATYGRVAAAAETLRLYGFAIPAGLGVALWVFARLARTRASRPWWIAFGAVLWNLGVAVGLAAILAGDASGYESLQMPRSAAVFLFLGYIVAGMWTLLTLRGRRDREMRTPHWFLLAALLWFPWIFSTAALLLLVSPVRGVSQSIIGWWYSENLQFVWMSLVGLAVVFHLIPPLTGRKLYSDYLGLFAFWTLLLFGGWACVPVAAPVPAWMPAISTVAAVMLIVPLIAVALNFYRTLGDLRGLLGGHPSGAFLRFGFAAWLAATLMKICGALPPVAALTHLTWFSAAQAQLNGFGFFSVTIFGAIYYIVPQVTGLEWPSGRSVRWHFFIAAAGTLFVALPLAAGGIVQGFKLNNPSVPFVDVSRSTLTFLRVSTFGELLVALGYFLLLGNLLALAVRFLLLLFLPLYRSAIAETKPAEVKP
jgi:cytochrome c oxidase cbb3-type subunit 1